MAGACIWSKTRWHVGSFKDMERSRRKFYEPIWNFLESTICHSKIWWYLQSKFFKWSNSCRSTKFIEHFGHTSSTILQQYWLRPDVFVPMRCKKCFVHKGQHVRLQRPRDHWGWFKDDFSELGFVNKPLNILNLKTDVLIQLRARKQQFIRRKPFGVDAKLLSCSKKSLVIP